MSNLNLNPLFDIRLVVSLAILLFLILGYFEWKKQVRFKVLRLLALGLTIAVVVIYVVDPSYTTFSEVKPILVLTDGYSSSQADSIRSLRPVEVINLTTNSNRFAIKDLADVKNQIRFVLGNGLPTSTFHNQSGYEFTYLPSRLPVGITDLFIPKFKAGVFNTLSGRFNCETKTVLTLTGPGYKDSIIVETEAKTFQFKIKPKLAGRFTYELVARSNNKEIQKEIIPIEVTERKKLNILFLQTFPTFETRYLKNYLEKDGHSILLRYETSKNIFRYETSNTPPIKAIEKINAEKLNAFDLVIMSNDAVNQLSSLAQTEIQESVKNGLGILILFNDETLPTKLINKSAITFKKVNYDSVSISLPESGKIKLPSLHNRINSNPEFTSIAEDKNGSVSGFQNYGRGRIGFQLVQNTYQLSLEGKNDVYQQLWFSLLENIAKPEQNQNQIKLESVFPFYVDQPLNVEIVSSKNTPEVFYDSERIPLLEHSSIPDLYQFTIWPKQSGWNRVALSDSTQLNFFVHPSNGLQSLAVANQIKMNKTHHSNNHSNAGQSRAESKRIPPLILFIIFLIAYGFLWLAPKL